MEETLRASTQTYDKLFLVLMLASLLLIFAAVLLVEVFSVNEGIGLGAYLQSNLTNTNVSASLIPTVLNVSTLRTAILEMYVLTGLGAGMFLIAFILYSMKGNRQSAEGRRYIALHLVMSLVFAGLFLMEFLSFNIAIDVLYLGAIYAALAVCIVVDAYMELAIHMAPSKASVRRKDVSIDPNTPYSNLVALRDQIFATFSGKVRIVDKHFNSEALSNMHRLLSGLDNGISAVSIVTSKEMLDSDFYQDYTDMKNEMKNRGIELGVMLMDDADAVAQHERFVFDDNVAYKIPPMKIIHKKSEHITKIKTGDARRRFEELQKKAITLENYAVKQARKPTDVE